jgi:hypothetical protein
MTVTYREGSTSNTFRIDASTISMLRSAASPADGAVTQNGTPTTGRPAIPDPPRLRVDMFAPFDGAHSDVATVPSRPVPVAPVWVPINGCHNVHVTSVTRLVTFADLDDDAAHARQISVSLRHEALLANGRRVLLLADRGWSVSVGSADPIAAASIEVGQRETSDIWMMTSIDDIIDTARIVVGPDEPPHGRSHENAAADHWADLTEVLRGQGVVTDGAALWRLPHDVVLSTRLLARLGS